MSQLNYLIILVLIILITALIYFYNEHRKKQKRKEELRLQEQLRQDLTKPLREIDTFYDEFQKLKGEDKYISHYDLFSLKSNFYELHSKLNCSNYQWIENFKNEGQKIDKFLKSYSGLDEIINSENKLFVAKEFVKCESLFDNIEGKSLDTQQRKAIITNQDNNLVIAGAGSGKTTTIAGKVIYLTKKLKINPKNILLISFTRKSANEMAYRIKNKMGVSLHVKTFHKLGLDIIANSQGIKPSIFDLSQKEVRELLNSIIENEKSNSTFFNSLINFFSFYLKPYKDINEFNSRIEHDNYLKQQKFEGYKIVQKTSASGIKIRYREKLKSQEEVLIANFLFRNRIKYEYEEKYKYKTASKKFGQYKPDFYLPEYDIYIEHFGIDKDGKVPKWFKGDQHQTAQEKYTEGIEWKRNEHRQNNTTLIESYSWEQKDGVLLTNLEKKLKKKGVKLNPLPKEEFWNYIQTNAQEDIDVFTHVLNTFLVLFKSNNENIDRLLNKAKQENNIRALEFLGLFRPILKNYEAYLRDREEIDFSDMINLASKLVDENEFESNYEYIIIDEFQDISQSRYQLIKALLDQKPKTKLFCVGDDWQSIFRFAGSDIGIFTDFSDKFSSSPLKGFKRYTNTFYIETTYRFAENLIKLTSSFILSNPNQIEKSLKSNKKSSLKPVIVHKYEDPERNGQSKFIALEKALSKISSREKDHPVSILLLGRYDFEKRVLDNSSSIQKKYIETENRYEFIFKKRKNLNIHFLTAHSSKGLEADYVIILNGNSGTYGFPSEISDDPLLNFLLSKSDQYPNGEERRLFYVAMTRAKKQVHILSSHEYPSSFIEEIYKTKKKTGKKCNWCESGDLIERKGPYGYFFSCSNNHYCNFTQKIDSSEFNSKAALFYDQEEFKKAIPWYQKSLACDSNDADINYKIAKCYEETGQLNKALNYYSESIKLDSSRPYSYYWRASTYFDLKNYDDAIKDWKTFEKMKPQGNSVQYWLANSFYKNMNFAAAYYYANKATRYNDPNTGLPDLMANCIKKVKENNDISFSTEDSPELIVSLKLAIDYEFAIRFNYHKSIQFDGGIKSLRTIMPKEFKEIGSSICISGYCYLREEERTFNIDRISNLILNPKQIENWSE